MQKTPAIEKMPSTRVLSIIIPAMNAAQTLGSLLDFLLPVEMPSGWMKEIICSYTASHDDTLRILESRNVKIVHCTTIGPGAARNTAVAEASGELFHFIDADARPVGDDFYFRLIRAVEEHDQDDGFGGLGGPILLDPKQQRNPIAQADHFACWFNWSALRQSELTKLFQPTVSIVIPRYVYESIDGYDRSIRVLEDYDFHKRALEAGFSFYFVQDVAVTHHARDTIMRSWRHSWYWGIPFRSAYLEKANEMSFGIPPKSNWFWINLPIIFTQRLRLVLRSARSVSVLWTLLALPFVVITVFSWSLASVVGHNQPSAATPPAV